MSATGRPERAERFLCIRLSALGDVVHALSALALGGSEPIERGQVELA